MKKKGFSLIELAISLAIIGLLMVMVMGGANLIDNAKLNSVIIDIYNLEKAIADFKQQYKYYPGDFPDAGQLWTSATCPNSPVPSGCNGNGDGLVTYTTTADGYEIARVMQHMGLAGMIKGNYIGNPASVTGTYYPSSFPGASFTLQSFVASYTYTVFGVSGTAIIFGSFNSNIHTNNYAALTPLEAEKIDSKIDDGIADSGQLFAMDGANVSSGSCSAPASSSGANYNLSYKAPACVLLYWLEKF